MATTTKVLMLELLSEMFDDWWTEDATGGSTSTVVDTKLAQLSEDDDFCERWYFRITETGHAALGQVRRIKRAGYVASTTTATINSTFAGAISSGDAYELHRINPTAKLNALNQAARDSFPYLYLPYSNEPLVVDDRLSNSGFETFSSGFTSWTEVGSPTVTEETTRVYHGSSAAKVVSAAGAAGQLTQAPTININEIAGKTATFKRRVWASAASVARLRLDWDGTDFENGDYHEGDSEWRLLSVSGTVPTDATQVKVICETALGTKTAYFDGGPGTGLFIDPIYRYTLPSALVGRPYAVQQQYFENEVTGIYLPFADNESPLQGRGIRIIGKSQLSEPTTDAGTFEIGAPQTQLFLAYAARWLARMGWLKDKMAESNKKMEEVAFWTEEIKRLLAQPGMKTEGMNVELSQAYHYDAKGPYLIFDNPSSGTSS